MRIKGDGLQGSSQIEQSRNRVRIALRRQPILRNIGKPQILAQKMLIVQMVIVISGLFLLEVLWKLSIQVLPAAQKVLEQSVFLAFGEECVSSLSGKIVKVAA
jgi:hypothetical protein